MIFFPLLLVVRCRFVVCLVKKKKKKKKKNLEDGRLPSTRMNFVLHLIKWFIFLLKGFFLCLFCLALVSLALIRLCHC